MNFWVTSLTTSLAIIKSKCRQRQLIINSAQATFVSCIRALTVSTDKYKIQIQTAKYLVHIHTDTELELINTDTDTHWEILNTDAWYKY